MISGVERSILLEFQTHSMMKHLMIREVVRIRKEGRKKSEALAKNISIIKMKTKIEPEALTQSLPFDLTFHQDNKAKIEAILMR